MATSAITSSLLAEIASSPSSANQFVTDLNQLAQDLESGNLSAAQEDYVTLSQDALNGVTSSTATTGASGITTNLLSEITSSSSSSSSFVSELNLLGTDLGNGDLTSASATDERRQGFVWRATSAVIWPLSTRSSMRNSARV